MMIYLTPIVSKLKKTSGINPPKVKKFALNSQLQTVQILTNDVQMLIFCLSYFTTAVLTYEIGSVNVIITNPLWVVNTRIKMQGTKGNDQDETSRFKV